MTDELLHTYFQECEDLLALMEEGIRTLQEGDKDDETINSIFRAVHSIKGGAGAFGLDDLVGFSHSLETLLDGLRSNQMQLNDEVMEVLLRSGDVLSDLVFAASTGTACEKAKVDQQQAEIEVMLEGIPEPDENVSFVPNRIDLAPEPDECGLRELDIDLAFKPGVFFAGHDPINFIRGLSELGEASVVANTDSLPLLEAFDPTAIYMNWQIHLKTSKSDAEILEVFEFADDLCEVSIADVFKSNETPAESASLVEMLLAEATAGRPKEDDSGTTQSQEQGGDSQDSPAGGKPPNTGVGAKSIRVDLDRVDNLVNAVGELVIQQASLTQAIKSAELPAQSDVVQGVDELAQLSREIQERVMAIRAQPIRPLFQRMHRIVREACGATGKQAKLVNTGEDTEVDASVVERLAEPLTHILRNAVDHGIEAPSVRLGTKKPSEGKICLSAAHKSGRVEISVSDDGAGVDRPKVLKKALEKGLVAEGANLTDAEIDALLFAPGFSTASSVTSLSGRGVGMDVVKNEIKSLGGRISISSQTGTGTTITISLPLTLAVLDGIVVEVAEQTLVIPTASILETLRPSPTEFEIVATDQEVLSVRGQYLPVVDLGMSLGFGQGGDVVIVVDSGGDLPVALRVQQIHDQRQVVIKSLEPNYQAIPGVAAATVFGDGRVGLIMDTVALAEGQQFPNLPIEAAIAQKEAGDHAAH